MTLVDADTRVWPTRLRVLKFISPLLDVYSVECVVLVLTCKVYPGGNSIDIIAILKLDLYLQS